jgi:L-histidine N-alpha-methyltransferase
VRIDGADLEITFADGEEIRTEISAKFTREAVERELRAAGLRLDEFFTDGSRLFGLAFARADAMRGLTPPPPAAAWPVRGERRARAPGRFA